MKQKAVDNVYMDELDMRDEVNTRPEPSEELEPVQLDDNPEHLAYIGSRLAEDLRRLLIHFLKQNKDVFAWKQEDMGGIVPAIITHRLNVNPSFKPVKQKRRSFAPERQKAINEEVGKLFQKGAIREVEYPEWLANVVHVATPEPILTWLAGPNQNPGDARPKPLTKSVYQIHFILKSLRNRFQFRASP